MLGLWASEGKLEGRLEQAFGWVQVGVEVRRTERGEVCPLQTEGQEVETTVQDVLVANLEEELVGLLEFHAGPQEALLGSAVVDSTVEPVEGWISV